MSVDFATLPAIVEDNSMATPAEVISLIDRFHKNAPAYRSGQYNETQVRREFIDPLFEALGWDISNKGGAAEAYKDVIHEDAIKIGGSTKAPDYCFRVGGARRFFGLSRTCRRCPYI
jgi:hypothetical protein